MESMAARVKLCGSPLFLPYVVGEDGVRRYPGRGEMLHRWALQDVSAAKRRLERRRRMRKRNRRERALQSSAVAFGDKIAAQEGHGTSAAGGRTSPAKAKTTR